MESVLRPSLCGEKNENVLWFGVADTISRKVELEEEPSSATKRSTIATTEPEFSEVSDTPCVSSATEYSGYSRTKHCSSSRQACPRRGVKLPKPCSKEDGDTCKWEKEEDEEEEKEEDDEEEEDRSSFRKWKKSLM